MEIQNIQSKNQGLSYSKSDVPVKKAQNTEAEPVKDLVKPDISNIQAHYAPNLSFRGNASNIKNAYIITGEEKDVPLLASKIHDSYIVDFDAQTEIIYGKAAIDYINSNEAFEYDTQVIFPKKAEGTLTVDGKDVNLPENSAVLINGGTKAKVSVKKGYPMIILSKKDYDWYERYNKNAKDINIKNKFSELIYWNSHLYDGDFTANNLLSENLTEQEFLKSIGIDKYDSKVRNNLVSALYEKRELLSEEDKKTVEFAKGLIDKMYEKGFIKDSTDGFLSFTHRYKPSFEQKELEKAGFSEDEIKAIMPIYSKARLVNIDSKITRKNDASAFRPELVKKMKERKILHNNKKDLEHIYWRDMYGNKADLAKKLEEKGFTKDEIEEITNIWEKRTKSGFDVSGLKFINDNLAVYHLEDKLNNWTHEETNWITNSTAMSSSKEDAPFLGVSMVQLDDDKTVLMKNLRKEEKLHAHPNREEKRQTEVYLITSGAAAINVVKQGESKVQILKEGDLAVVGPGVLHCVNSVSGEYEHIVAQVPSAFQYGFSFKEIVEPPEDYDEKRLETEALKQLEEYKKEAGE